MYSTLTKTKEKVHVLRLTARVYVCRVLDCLYLHGTCSLCVATTVAATVAMLAFKLRDAQAREQLARVCCAAGVSRRTALDCVIRFYAVFPVGILEIPKGLQYQVEWFKAKQRIYVRTKLETKSPHCNIRNLCARLVLYKNRTTHAAYDDDEQNFANAVRISAIL
jgi:hypothetical protein